METNHHPKTHSKSNFWLITLVINATIALGALLSATPALANNTSTSTETTTTQITNTNREKMTSTSDSKTLTSSDEATSKTTTTFTKEQRSNSVKQSTSKSQAPAHFYSPQAFVTVRHVDQDGNILARGRADYPMGPYSGNPYLTQQKHFPNYHFVGMGEHSLPANGVLNTHGNNGTITYVYSPEYSSRITHVHETIHFVDQYGVEFKRQQTSRLITFATVTNLTNGQSNIYYSKTAWDAKLNNQGIPVNGEWIKSDHALFDAIDIPTIDGYQAYSTNAPSSNPDRISAQTVSANSADLDFTVKYVLEKQPVTITFIDDNTDETLFSKVIWIYYKHHNDYDPTGLINYYKRHGYTFVSSDFPIGGLDFDSTKRHPNVYYIHLNSFKEPDIVDESDSDLPVVKKPLIESPLKKDTQKTVTPAPKSDVTDSPKIAKTVTTKRYIGAHIMSISHRRSLKIKDSFDFWVKFRKQPSQPSSQAVFDDWSNELEKIIKMNGDNNTHSELGKVLKTMSGRMLFGQKNRSYD